MVQCDCIDCRGKEVSFRTYYRHIDRDRVPPPEIVSSPKPAIQLPEEEKEDENLQASLSPPPAPDLVYSPPWIPLVPPVEERPITWMPADSIEFAVKARARKRARAEYEGNLTLTRMKWTANMHTDPEHLQRLLSEKKKTNHVRNHTPNQLKPMFHKLHSIFTERKMTKPAQGEVLSCIDSTISKLLDGVYTLPTTSKLLDGFVECSRIKPTRIHICPNECVLFYGEREDLDHCPQCGASRYKVCRIYYVK